MRSSPERLFRQLKVVLSTTALFLLVVAIQGSTLWLRHHAADAGTADRLLAQAQQTTAQADQRLQVITARQAVIPFESATQESRKAQADKIGIELQGLSSTWDRVVGNPAQQQANREQMAKMTALSQASAQKLAELKVEARQLSWEKDGAEIDRENAVSFAATLRASYPTLPWYFRLAVRRDYLWFLVAMIAAWFLGGVGFKPKA